MGLFEYRGIPLREQSDSDCCMGCLRYRRIFDEREAHGGSFSILTTPLSGNRWKAKATD